MSKWRKKPVVIEAVQWLKHGDHPGVRKAIWSHDGGNHCPICGGQMEDVPHGVITTLEGDHRVCPSDWIIQGAKGEVYPCKPDIFAATYEPVEESTK